MVKSTSYAKSPNRKAIASSPDFFCSHWNGSKVEKRCKLFSLAGLSVVLNVAACAGWNGSAVVYSNFPYVLF